MQNVLAFQNWLGVIFEHWKNITFHSAAQLVHTFLIDIAT